MNLPLPKGEHVIVMPIGVITCGLCRGNGQFMQNWCDAPRSMGMCDMCKGAQFIYEATALPVPESVRQQIATLNGFVEAPEVTCIGLLLRKVKVLRHPDKANRFEFFRYDETTYDWAEPNEVR